MDFRRSLCDWKEWQEAMRLHATLRSWSIPVQQSTVAMLEGGTPLPSHFGHGTMVAGLIHVVAPTAKIMPLKSFNADGTGSISNISAAIYYAADNGAKIINMSFEL